MQVNIYIHTKAIDQADWHDPSIVWTEESWLQKYANPENDEEQKETQTNQEENSNSDQEAEPHSVPGGKSRVYMDIAINGSLLGRIEMEVLSF